MERSAAISAAVPQTLPMQMPHRQSDPRAAGKAMEQMFASMLIKQMRQTLDGGLFGDDKSDVLGGLFDHFLGQHIAQAGGLGIGDMIRHQLERQSARAPTA